MSEFEARFIETAGISLAANIRRGEGAPVVMFLNSLAADASMWDAVIADLPPHWTLITYDARGHGRSGPAATPFDLDALADDAAAVSRAFDIGPLVLCGLSLGAATAIRVASRPELQACALVAANTALSFPPASMWKDRADTALSSGMGPLVEPTLQRWLTPAFRDRRPQLAAAVADMIGRTSPQGYAGCCKVLGDLDIDADARRVACPATVIVGRHDASTPAERGKEIAAAISGARLSELDAAHLSAVEQPSAFAVQLVELVQESWRAAHGAGA